MLILHNEVYKVIMTDTMVLLEDQDPKTADASECVGCGQMTNIYSDDLAWCLNCEQTHGISAALYMMGQEN